jgi:hypothetical protein
MAIPWPKDQGMSQICRQDTAEHVPIVGQFQVPSTTYGPGLRGGLISALLLQRRGSTGMQYRPGAQNVAWGIKAN